MSASFGFLSSYPPTQCGLATFTAALQAEIAAAGHETGVVRVLERPDPFTGPTVVASHGARPTRRGRSARPRPSTPSTWSSSSTSTASTTAPTATASSMSSTARPCPASWSCTPCWSTRRRHQREVLDAIGRRAERAGHDDRDGARAAHRPLRRRRRQGRRDPARRRPTARDGRRHRPDGRRPADAHVGPARTGQGHRARHRRAAVASGSRSRDPHYLVVGETHPRVLERDGEAYRDGLIARAAHPGRGGHGDLPSPATSTSTRSARSPRPPTWWSCRTTLASRSPPAC